MHARNRNEQLGRPAGHYTGDLPASPTNNARPSFDFNAYIELSMEDDFSQSGSGTSCRSSNAELPPAPCIWTGSWSHAPLPLQHTALHVRRYPHNRCAVVGIGVEMWLALLTLILISGPLGWATVLYISLAAAMQVGARPGLGTGARPVPRRARPSLLRVAGAHLPSLPARPSPFCFSGRAHFMAPARPHRRRF